MDSYTSASGIDPYQMLIPVDFYFLPHQDMGHRIVSPFYLDMTVRMNGTSTDHQKGQNVLMAKV